MKGLGNDIIELGRFQKSLERHGDEFVKRLFTPEEIAYCRKHKDPLPHYAGRFAAKEAIAKALGTGIGKELAWHDLRIVKEESGKPVVEFSEAAKMRFHHPQVLVSISHCESYATAVAVWL